MNRLHLKQQSDPAFFPTAQILPAGAEEGRVLIGDVYSLEKDVIAKEDIKAIISCSKECDCRTKLGDSADGIRILQLNVRDTPADNIGKYFDDAYSFIQRGRKDGTVLVQCMAGKSRSSAIILAYIMRRLGVSLDSALSFMKKKRPKVNPNEGFMNQLKLYEKDLGVSESKRQIDLDEMKQNISANPTRNKMVRQTATVPKEKVAVVPAKPQPKPNLPDAKKLEEKTVVTSKLLHKRSRSSENSPSKPDVRGPRHKTDGAFNQEDDEPKNTRLANLKAEVSYMLTKLQMSRYGQLIYDY